MWRAGSGTLRGARPSWSSHIAHTLRVLAATLLAVVIPLRLLVGGAAGSVGTVAVRHIYWTNTATTRGPFGPGIDTVARADLNGGNINRDLVKTEDFPGAIAVDAKHIYWVNGEGNTLARASINGSHVNHSFIPHPYRPVGEFEQLLVQGGYIYWTQFASTKIGRARIDGTHLNPNFVNIGPVKRFIEILGLATDGKHLYWSDAEAGGTIGRVDLSGKHARKRFMVRLGAVSSLTADNRHLYWVNARWGTIGRSDLSGRHRIRPFIVGPALGGPVGAASIAVDAQHIYWTNYGASTIGRADLSGRNVNSSFIHAGVEDETGSSAPAGLAVGP